MSSRHSGATSAQVPVTYGDDGIDIEVRDPGRGGRPRPTAPVASGGHGLVGLRERTRLLGGALDYGASDDAGFVVTAHRPSPTPAAT
jgi:signal transduction histidine kinase